MQKPKRIVAMALAWLIFTSLASFAAEQQDKRIRPVANPSKASQDSPSVATSVFQKVSRSVVIVEALSSSGRVQGSGVVYDNDRSILIRDLEPAKLPAKLFSYVVTNAHVVKNASSVSVLEGGKRYRADVNYVDDEFDLALLYVHANLLLISPPFSGAELKVGEKVFAIGSPLGLENSISEGIISGKREQNGVLLLQTTAPISKGSSGGGLFDGKGRFVGVTTFKLVGGENLNFAVDAGRISEIGDAKVLSTLLRVATIDYFSPDEEAIINSDALTEWILKEKLSVEIRRRWEEASDSGPAEALDKVKKEYVQILGRFLREQAGTTANTQNKPEIVLLVCTLVNSEGQNRGDVSLKLDYTNRTVNGYPAQFTDAEVRWTLRGKNKESYYILNRYSGSLRSSSEEYPSLPIGHCSPVAEQKF